ncbi:PadR family transcriptional regulator [Williamsia phyllosphaerae]|uniref:PadR family transcriptional regulator n=1 Tax=Williamsia phyllosphaerae TaxID=885042 RepID=A0ABQ1V6C3_9NOCA|nr:PadR family transcriptional regulator [Williamsia phyllosphaerae]GGF38632.1 PadR family transcriptional regulator [Williamsia phyllosphaerae]
MALEHAIMVSLAERPGTGYEIGRQFDRSIGYFWSATHQQIYRTLKKLHDDGLVAFESVAQDARPDKKVYTLSDSGRDALRAWVSDRAPVPRLRDELSVKLRAAEHGDLTDLVAEMRRHRDIHTEQLALYRAFADRDHPDAAATTGRRLHQYLVLRGGIRIEEGFVDWLDEVVTALEHEMSTSPAQPGTSPTQEKVSR